MNSSCICFISREKRFVVIDLLDFKFAKKLGSANSKPTNYKSANCKKWCPQIADPQSTALAEGSQIFKIFKSANLRFCKLRNLFADPPPLKSIF